MIEGLGEVLNWSGQPGLAELRELLEELSGGTETKGRLTDQQRVGSRVYRLRVETGHRVHALVVKCLRPDWAHRDRLVADRWLPAVGLSRSGPPLLGVAADRKGRCVWHVYEDLGECTLAAGQLELARVEAAVKLLVQIHCRFAEHPLLAECRLDGNDLGTNFFAFSVCDAIRSLESIPQARVELSVARLAVRNRLLERMNQFLGEQSYRAQVTMDSGLPDTLLHGDLTIKNTLVFPVDGGLHARLIDWDHLGVGPVSYDLSRILGELPPDRQGLALNIYQRGMEVAGWPLPSASDWEVLCNTAGCARLANCVIWAAMSVLDGHSEYGFDELELLDQQFDHLGQAPYLNSGNLA